MKKLIDVPNIGNELERQLNLVGIYSIDDLKKRGAKQTWLDIKQIDSSACINRLYALEGAIKSIRWHDLDANTKSELKIFYEKNKQ